MEVDEESVKSVIRDSSATEEEFQNFMHRVHQVEKIVKKLASDNPQEQKLGTMLADEILDPKVTTEISDVGELKIKSSRTVINKIPLTEQESDPNKMSQEAFMKSVEKDAKQRAEDRKIRNERADTFKRIANKAFKEQNYEKAITYYTKAVEQKKDSAMLWNNRALSYMKLGLYEKALNDCDWALKVNEYNIKALLNGAKCYKFLRQYKKFDEFIHRAKESNPDLIDFIDEFVENLDNEVKVPLRQEVGYE
ncbi:tetratricopeptide repeat protein 12-like [Neodiprion virginianus]|uniref:tetratricopeptide repeat protein 12-like n=1 Tax=Neodiprion fabricii TaxID=2872261 RepID=UPI001ED8F771|nr:tetratricopeptide repeat protein 12-like [Neodiprion fabricii]XP_046623541.1 tetratricopeptide repeat protein 12-like [Neodiprion virginianus]